MAPAKLERCVKNVKIDLKRRGIKGNPWAICKSALYKSKKNKK